MHQLQQQRHREKEDTPPGSKIGPHQVRDLSALFLPRCAAHRRTIQHRRNSPLSCVCKVFRIIHFRGQGGRGPRSAVIQRRDELTTLL